MHLKRIIPVLLILMVLSCRRSDDEALFMLNHAEEIMEEHYDSAYAYLYSIEEPDKKFTEADYMRFLLRCVEAANKAYLPIDTFSYMPRVVEYYQKHGTPYEKTNSLYLMGSIFRDRHDAPRAINYFKKSLDVEYPEFTKMDYLKFSDAYYQIANLYSSMSFHQKALKYLDKRIEYALKAGDTLTAILSYDSKSDIYKTCAVLGFKNLDIYNDSAINISRNAYRMLKERGEDRRAAAILPTQISYYLDYDSMEKARVVIDEYTSKSGLVDFEKREMKRERNSSFYFSWGRYYIQSGRNDSALYFFRKLYGIRRGSNYRVACKGLVSVFAQMGKPDSVYKYINLYSEAINKEIETKASDELLRAVSLYDYNESERQAMEKTKEADNLRALIYIIICIVIISALVIYISVKRQRDKKKAELMAVNQKYNEVLTRYGRAEEEMKSLKSDIGEQISIKAEEIKHLKQVLSSYTENVNPEQWNAEENLLQHESVIQMHRNAARAKSASDSEWTDVEAVISKMLPDFYAALSDSRGNISYKEFRMCLLARLNFIPTEIATLMDSSKQTVSNLRSSVNRKLFGEGGSKTFDANIHGLSKK